MSYENSIKGKLNKIHGKSFEDWISHSFEWYGRHGLALVEKTPEPMRPTKSLGNGKFIAFFEKKAQTDYIGTIKGGNTIVFEAKYTENVKMEQNRVQPNQSEYLEEHSRMGAKCYVIAGFSSGSVYRVPWDVWRDMKAMFGRKYVTEADLAQYRVPEYNGILTLID